MTGNVYPDPRTHSKTSQINPSGIPKVQLGKNLNPQQRTGDKTYYYDKEARFPLAFHFATPEGKAINTTSEDLSTGKLEPGWFYVFHNITAMQETAGTPQIQLILKRESGEEIILDSSTIGNAEDTGNAVGEFIINDRDKIIARFKGANSSNQLHLYITGYRIAK